MIFLYLFISLLIIAALCYYVYKESTGYHVVKYSLCDSRIKKDLISIVFISDLHNCEYGKGNAELLKEIDNINPDYVFLGGDILTSCMEKWTGFDTALSFVTKLCQKYKVYYGMGNHEERLERLKEKFPENTYSDYIKELDKIGAPILDDEIVRFNDLGIDLYGLNLDHEYYRKFVTKHFDDEYLHNKLSDTDKDKYSILLAHNPEHFKQYAKWGADLVLSGHVHGGIIRIPFLGGAVSPALKLFPKYDGGLFTEGNSKMILSRGLGTHTIPIRINNKAELIVIELTNK